MTENNVVDWHTKMAADFDRKYTKNKAFRERYAVWTKTIDKYSSWDSHVLDIGCGSGILSFYLAERNGSVIGVDGSIEMLRICQARKREIGMANVEFLNYDIMSLGQIFSAQADLIVCSSVLEYLDDLTGSLRLLASFMKDRGILVLSMPNKHSLYRLMEPLIFKLTGRPRYYKYIRNVCSLEEIESKLMDCGLKVVESSYYAKTPFVSKVLHRIGLPQYSDNLFITVAQRL